MDMMNKLDRTIMDRNKMNIVFKIKIKDPSTLFTHDFEVPMFRVGYYRDRNLCQEFYDIENLQGKIKGFDISRGSTPKLIVEWKTSSQSMREAIDGKWSNSKLSIHTFSINQIITSSISDFRSALIIDATLSYQGII